jgi:SAM-dependent methyltransferase
MNQNYFYKPYQPKTLEKVRCAVCDSDKGQLVLKENNLNIMRCGECDYVFVNPRPCAGDLKDFYQEYYPDQDGLPESWGGEMSAIFSSIYRQVNADRNGGRILDIGSSYGHFLSQFDASSWQATGVDPSSSAVGYSREHYPHITAHDANFEDVALEPGSFDIITSFYVLEHVFDPRDIMQRIYSLLDADGLAIIRIPYTGPFFPVARMMGRPLMYAPMHLNDFAPSQFERMCRDIGFSRVESSIGARRNSSDLVEKLGAAVFSTLGQAYEAITPRRFRFPFAGAYTYDLYK